MFCLTDFVQGLSYKVQDRQVSVVIFFFSYIYIYFFALLLVWVTLSVVIK